MWKFGIGAALVITILSRHFTARLFFPCISVLCAPFVYFDFVNSPACLIAGGGHMLLDFVRPWLISDMQIRCVLKDRYIGRSSERRPEVSHVLYDCQQGAKVFSAANTMWATGASPVAGAPNGDRARSPTTIMRKMDDGQPCPQTMDVCEFDGDVRDEWLSSLPLPVIGFCAGTVIALSRYCVVVNYFAAMWKWLPSVLNCVLQNCCLTELSFYYLVPH